MLQTVLGYKFAISGGIPCVVSLDVPDDAEVVFDIIIINLDVINVL